MNRMQDILDIIQGMNGVHRAFVLGDDMVSRLVDCESRIKAVLDISVRNTGLEQCLSRDHVICIIKDATFRPPPEPTVLLLGDDDLVMGRELLPHERDEWRDREDVVFLSDDFVVFPEKRASERECFLMPPVSFPELEALNGCKDVVSCSPSTPGDMIIRSTFGIEDDPKLASILVAFNLDC